MAESMALALVTKLGSVAMGNLEKLAKEKFLNDYGLLVSVESEAQKLEPKLKLIQAVLDDAELKQMHQKTVKVWMESLKQIMYEADDVLDEWHTRASIFQSQITEASNFSRKAFSFLSSSQYCSCIEPLLPILFGNEFQLLSVRIDIARRIQGITTSLDTLSVNMQQLNLISNPTAEVNSLRTDRQTSSIVDVAEVFGRDNDKKAIVKLLLSERSKAQRDVPVISIVGAGGFGKTTLAKLVLEDEDIVNTFGPRNIWWVCVSEPFERERIAREINERATQQKHHGGLEDLHRALRESVGGKRFLLVLDDVWSENSDDWDPLRIALACGEQGSRILITTRNVKVAQMMRSSPNNMHKLGILSPEGCWSLFQHIAFQGREEDIKRLKYVGEELVAKCGGVPLAVKILAAHMRSQNTSDWRNVLANEIWKVQHQKFFPAFFLSYQALRSSLKQCLIYCCVFPKDAIIEKGELVTLWMAQGFLGSDGREELEMIGAECFDDLVMASFFQVLKKDDDADFKMHDLVHDFCQFLSGKECLVTSASPTEDMCGDQVRHMNVEYVENSPIYRAKNLRTLILRPALRPAQSVTSAVFHQLTCPRSLVLNHSRMEQLPNEVGSLLHLRYVDLSLSPLRELPETMCNLYNLQTLKLDWCRQLSKLPEEIGRLSNLRHLDIRYTDSLRYFPQSIGRLSHLRTLRKFIISERCKIQELGSLNHLSGALELEGLRHVGSVDEAKRAQLHQKEKLRHLGLNFRYLSYENEEDDDEYGLERMEGVLESLRPHVNLEELVIRGYPGSKFPFWMSRESFLPNIVKLELQTWKNLTELPCLGNLQYLETLTIEGLESVKHITSEFYGVGVETSFPMLKKLELSSMTRLEDWNIPFSNFKKVMPRLCDLSLWDCPKLREVPALGRLESLETLTINGLESVKHITSEFYGVGVETSFPMLKKLELSSMTRLEDWNSPFSNFKKVMPRLCDLSLRDCPKLREVPALGRLESLETLTIEWLESVKHITSEFYGVGVETSFPMLKKLGLSSMTRLEDWNIPFSNFKKVMPRLCDLSLCDCPKLREVPALGRLESLESLIVSGLNSVQNVAGDILGISDSSSSPDVVLFPSLTELSLGRFPEWQAEQTEEENEITGVTIMPAGLRKLSISYCEKLKVLPHYMFSHSLRELDLEHCPQLQLCLPPLLEKLTLHGDVGVLSKSLLPIIPHGNNNNNKYLNLRSVSIWFSPHSSLPEGLRRFTSLERLQLDACEWLDFKLEEELAYFPMLQKLETYMCDRIIERCIREDWGNQLCHQIPFQLFHAGRYLRLIKGN